MEKNGDDLGWRKPTLTVEGQTSFWDLQAERYERAEMTIDNSPELDAVIRLSREIMPTELVTLGGAVGCRDPKVIAEDLMSGGAKPPKIIFNDLSPNLVSKARDVYLKPLADAGSEIEYLTGEIKTVCQSIPNQPRRVIFGVYRQESFFASSFNPKVGFPKCGFEEYLTNSSILGTHFLMDWVRFTKDKQLESYGLRAKVSTKDMSREIRSSDKYILVTNAMNINRGAAPDLTALQVIGWNGEGQGFFISHWYTKTGFLRMLSEAFPSTHFSIKTEWYAKGMVCVVDPIGVKPTSVITVLNNVMGNVLPDDQFETLSAIRAIAGA